MSRLPFIVAVLGLSATFVAMADTDPSEIPAERPRVGLVLGGGGARGAAHIGVLKELERLRVPIDAIAGTSMGAIVGGLYASGHTADELEAVVQDMDWAAALSDRQPRSDLGFRRKQDEVQFPMRLEVGVKDGGVQLPQGAIQGHVLGLKLRELTLATATIDDFDELPIPFRAVAADIATGEIVVMGEGDLAQALRASMSVPGAFVPVEREGRLLVDGGLVGNLPVDIVREMGVDVVIAVDVEFPLYDVDELGSVLAVSEQMLTILIRNETQRQIDTLGDGDILIRPDLGKHGSADFGGILKTIPPGEDAARAAEPALAKLSLDEAAWEQHVAARRPPESADRIDFVIVRNNSRVSGDVLAARMDLEAGDPVNADRFAEEANQLFGLRIFEKVDYRLVDEDDQFGIVYDARKRSWGNGFLRFGLALEDDFEGSTAFNLDARLWWPAINSLGAEWRTDLTLGTDPAFTTEYYQPLRPDSRLFISTRLFGGQSNVGAFDNGDEIARFRLTDFYLGVDVGAELGNWGELRAGVFRGEGNLRLKIGDPVLPNGDFSAGGARMLLRFDTFDSPWFPREGMRGRVAWTLSREGLGADADYDTLAASLNAVTSRGRTSLSLGLDYGTTLSGPSAIRDQFPLGGFLRLSGLQRDQVFGPHAGLVRVIAYRRVGDSGGSPFEMPIYLGASLESGAVWQSRDDIGLSSMQTNGSLFLGVETFLGPVMLAAGLAEGGQSNFYLFVGRGFIGSGFRRPLSSGQY